MYNSSALQGHEWQTGKGQTITLHLHGLQSRVLEIIHPITDEVKELRLVLVYTQKLLPVTWYLLVPFHLPSGTFTSLRTWGCFLGYPSIMHQTPYPLAARHHGTVCVYCMTCVTYQSNETGVRGFIMLTPAAPSRITM